MGRHICGPVDHQNRMYITFLPALSALLQALRPMLADASRAKFLSGKLLLGGEACWYKTAPGEQSYLVIGGPTCLSTYLSTYE